MVGSGKSRILDYLALNYNCLVIKADEVAASLREKGGECYDACVSLLGSDCLCEDGSFDRKKVAEKIFTDTVLLMQMNMVLHPAVKRHVVSTIEKYRDTKDYIFFEAALLVKGGRYESETDFAGICDELWYIYVSREERYRRLREGRGYDDKKISDILGNQPSEDDFRNACKWIIDNSDEFSLTVEQIKLLIE